MASKRKPKHDDTIDGVRCRVYATRSEYEVIFDDGDIDDPAAEVFCYPKRGDAADWARQARAERKAEQ